MAYIDNTQTKKEIEDAIRGNSVSNLAPSKVSDNVQLVCNVNPKDYRRVNIVARQGGSGTVYTTPTDKEFYLTDTHLAGTVSAASTSATQTITITPLGQAAVICNSLYLRTLITNDATSGVSNFSFSKPILLARGSAITYAQANCNAQDCVIFGYTVEN